MPRFSGSPLRRAALLLSSLLRRAAQGESQREASTLRLLGGLALFAILLPLGLTGCKQLASPEPEATPGRHAARTSASRHEDHPRTFATTQGALTTDGTAPFLGNFTVIAPPSSANYFLVQRQPDCSLSFIYGPTSGHFDTPASGSGSITQTTTHYEQTLRQESGLKPATGAFQGGCVQNSVGKSSQTVAFSGFDAQGTGVVSATILFDQNAGTNALGTLTYNLNTNQFSEVFDTSSSVASAYGAIAIDLNGDGISDLVLVNPNQAQSAYASVLLGKSDGSFGVPVTYPIAGTHSSNAVVDDINNDGKLDIVAVSGDQQISVLFGNGDGTFQAARSFTPPAVNGFPTPASTPIYKMITADLNGDGNKDLICDTGLVLLGAGDGTFNAVPQAAFPFIVDRGPEGAGLAVGDLNKDGKLDLVVNSGTSIATWIGKGDGTFTTGYGYASIANSGDLTVADLDGDGNADIYIGLANEGLFSGDDSNSVEAYALLGNGDGTFQGAPTAGRGLYNGGNVADVNGDGRPDLVTNLGTEANPSGTFLVQLGTPSGSFGLGTTFTVPDTFNLDDPENGDILSVSGASMVTPSNYLLADVNGDGNADLVFTDVNLTATDTNHPGSSAFLYADTVVFVALGKGDGTFKTPIPASFPQIAPSGSFDQTLTITNLQVADINGDGHADLIASYDDLASVNGSNEYYRGIVVAPGNGDGTFKSGILTSAYSSTTAPTNDTVSVPALYAHLDLNGDGKPDLIAKTSTSAINASGFRVTTDTLLTYLGNGDGTFKAPIMTTLASNVYSPPIVADFNADNKPDLAFITSTSNQQLQLNIALGNGDGTFTAQTPISLANGYSLVAGDFNADGKMDLALLGGYGETGIFYGMGDGTFTSTLTNGMASPTDILNIEAGATGIAIDLNQDGKPDILAGSTILLNIYGSTPVVTGAASTTTALATSPNPAAVGASVTFTATITAAAGSTATPSGTVTFLDGTTTVGTGTLAAGTATYSTSTLAAGAHSITADYAGDANFAGSTSSAITETVTAAPAADFTIAVSPASTTVARGSAATATLSIAPVNGFNLATALTCTGAPTGTTCNIAPASVTLDGTATSTATVTLQTSASSSLINEHRNLALAVMIPLGLLGTPIFAFRRKHRLPALLASVLVLASLTIAIGCGHNSKSTPQAPSTYTLTLTGTSGAVTHSSTWTVTVQ